MISDFIFGFVYYLTIFILSSPILLWLVKEATMGMCTCTTSMKGKTVLITGGNNGIGLETSVGLAKLGARLIIGCRSTDNVTTRIQSRAPGAKVDIFKLDLSSMQSVRDFAEIVKSKYDEIHVLINNAGVANVKTRKTDDGLELLMATNYFGHALLNHLLFDLVKAGGEN